MNPWDCLEPPRLVHSHSTPDPLYVPISKTASFTIYTAGGFSWADQVALADTAAELTQRGVRVVLSNADSPKIHQLYGDRGFTLTVVQAQRAISASGASRQPVSELIISSPRPTNGSANRVRWTVEPMPAGSRQSLPPRVPPKPAESQ